MKNSASWGAQIILAFALQLLIGCASIAGPADQAVGEAKIGSPVSSNATQAAGVATNAEDAKTEIGLAQHNKTQPSFTRIRIDRNKILYVNQANALESYDNWLIDTAVVEFSEDHKPLSDSDLRRLEKMLEDVQRSQTAASGAPIVDAASPCTLKQQLKLKSLQLSTLDDAVSQVNMVSSFGSAVVLAEVRDSLTGDVVFAWSEAISLGGGMSGHGGPKIERLDREIRRALRNGGEVLLNRFPLKEERINNRSQFGCSGQLGRNAFKRRGEQAVAP